MKHTASPWKESPHTPGYLKGPDNDGVAIVCDKLRSRGEFEANTRLIATAPDMLNLLEQLLGDFDSPKECACDGSDDRPYACYFHRNEEEIRRLISKVAK